MKFSRPEYWSGQPFPSPGDLPNPGVEPRSPALQADSLPAEPTGTRTYRKDALHVGAPQVPFHPSLCSPSLQTPERLQHNIPCLFCSSPIPSFQFLIIRVILAFLLSSRFLPFITITRDFTAKEIWNLTPGKFTTCRVASAAYILHCLCLMIWYFKYKVSPVSILFLFFACIPHVLQQPLLKGRQGR